MPAEHGEAAQHKSIFNKDQINDFIYIYSFGRRFSPKRHPNEGQSKIADQGEALENKNPNTCLPRAEI